jgi:hypothetical protein
MKVHKCLFKLSIAIFGINMKHNLKNKKIQKQIRPAVKFIVYCDTE